MATSIIKTDELRLLNDQVVMSDGTLTGNVTFPAGHVVGQAITFYNEITSYSQAHGTSAGEYALTEGIDLDDLTVSYIPKDPNNKLFVSGVVTFGTSVPVYSALRVKRQINSGGYSFLESVMNVDEAAMAGSSSRKAIAGYSTNGLSASGWISANLGFGFIDSSHISSVGDTVHYKLNHTYSGNDASNKTLYINRNFYPTNDYGSYTAVSYIRIEEIQND